MGELVNASIDIEEEATVNKPQGLEFKFNCRVNLKNVLKDTNVLEKTENSTQNLTISPKKAKYRKRKRSVDSFNVVPNKKQRTLPPENMMSMICNRSRRRSLNMSQSKIIVQNEGRSRNSKNSINSSSGNSNDSSSKNSSKNSNKNGSKNSNENSSQNSSEKSAKSGSNSQSRNRRETRSRSQSRSRISARSRERSTEVEGKQLVMFTGFISSSDSSLVVELGGQLTCRVADCTVLVAANTKRTAKLISVVARGKPVVSPKSGIFSVIALHCIRIIIIIFSLVIFVFDTFFMSFFWYH